MVWKSCQGFFELHFCHICLIILLYYNCIHVYINKTILLCNVIYISFRNRSKIWHICHKPITSTCPSLFAISFVPVLYLGNVYPKVISPLEVNCPSFSLFMVLFQQTWLLIDGWDAFLLVFFFLRHFLVSQGSYRSWKTWKVMEFQNFIFHAWKVMEFNCRFLKFMESDKSEDDKAWTA